VSTAHSNQTIGDEKPRNRAWLFLGASGATREEIWRWWEERRYAYNRDLFLVGVLAWVLVLVAGSAAVKPGVDFEEPIMMIFGPLLYAIFANVPYTSGPIFDTVFYRENPRRHLFKAGYFFSLVLTSLPGVRAVVAWISTLVTGKKLD
jgi:hypothetical protein